MRAFIKFNKGLMKIPFHWQVWLMLLVTANLIVPLYINHFEAIVVIVTLMTSMMIMTGLWGDPGSSDFREPG